MFKYGVRSRAYEDIKIRTVLELEQTADGKDNSERIASIDRKLQGKYVPPSFDGDRSVEIAYDKGFEKLYAMLSQEFGVDRHDLTVMAFYSHIELMKEQNESKNRVLKGKSR